MSAAQIRTTTRRDTTSSKQSPRQRASRRLQ
jgi:hypothetical protein